jgi:DNA helicase II / ATP-dependent DNA helicase PcrA
MDFIANLNTQQQRAVTAGLGPILVVAGPGSGKTRVLTQRIAYLIGSMGVRPYQILAVTFTNKAAREMENRVKTMLGGMDGGLSWAPSTPPAPASCAGKQTTCLSLPTSSSTTATTSSPWSSGRARSEPGREAQPPAGLHAAISRAKNELITAELYPASTYRDEVNRRVYQRYQELLLANNAVDFDDLLLWVATCWKTTFRCARSTPGATSTCWWTSSRIPTWPNTACSSTGLDPPQYFRGRRHRPVDLPLARSGLPQRVAASKRTTRPPGDPAGAELPLHPEHLGRGDGVIDRNPQRTKKAVHRARRGAEDRLYEAYDERVQAAFVVDTIAKTVASKKAGPGILRLCTAPTPSPVC